MKIKITPKTAGNKVNCRRAMSGAAKSQIVKRYSDGDVVEATLARNGKWYKTPDGYVLAELCEEVPYSDVCEIE